MYKYKAFKKFGKYPFSVVVCGSIIGVYSTGETLEDVVTSAFASSCLSDNEVLKAVEHFYKFGSYTGFGFSIEVIPFKTDINPYEY